MNRYYLAAARNLVCNNTARTPKVTLACLCGELARHRWMAARLCCNIVKHVLRKIAVKRVSYGTDAPSTIQPCTTTCNSRSGCGDVEMCIHH